MNEQSYEINEERHHKKRVLIVDDIRTDLHYVGKLITGFGHEAILADSAISALEIIDNDTDLVIADGIMPDMDGFDLVKSIKSQSAISHIPVIMVTSLSGREDRIKALEAGVNDFVTKPVDKVELRARINSMLKMKEAQDKVRSYQKELEKRVEIKTQDLNTTLHKLQAVLHGMNDCMVTMNKDHVITELNQAFLKATGKNTLELKGYKFETFLSGANQFDAFKILLNSKNMICELDIEFPQWAGKIFSVLVTHMENGGHILVMRDVTGKKQADVQRARFLSILSHELRTPLNGIKGFSDVILDNPKQLSKEYINYVGMINECGIQLETIVEELLNFVQLYNGSEEPEATDARLDILVQDVMARFEEHRIKKNIQFSVSIEGDQPVVHGKSEHLFEIIRQIIDNSIKFGRQDGKTDIIIKKTKDNILFICRDNGKGIPKKNLNSVFESFFQVEAYTTRTQEGLGLGLTIVKRIVEMYKGTIEIKSRENEWTEVSVSFPRP